jgi:hypothetical protein
LRLVEAGTVHLIIVGDPLLSRFPADQGASHGTGDDAAGRQKDCCRQDEPASEGEVGDEDENVDEEGEQGEKEGRDGQDKYGE